MHSMHGEDDMYNILSGNVEEKKSPTRKTYV